MKSKNIIHRIMILILFCAGLGLASIFAASLMIHQSSEGRLYEDPSFIPYRRVGLVLGCAQYLADGRCNLFYTKRIHAAAELFHTQKVDYFIVSGDNHVIGYDEPTDMKHSLINAGVPENRIYCDYAGFRTLDSIVRAREIFGQTNITVISQEFHNKRAIFIASRKGIDAIGFNADDVDSYNGFKTNVREQLAKVKTIMDVYLFRTAPKFLGPGVEIGEN